MSGLLRLDDRIHVALGANMGFHVDAHEVEGIARTLVILRQIDEGCKKSRDRGGNLGKLIATALKPFEGRT